MTWASAVATCCSSYEFLVVSSHLGSSNRKPSSHFSFFRFNPWIRGKMVTGNPGVQLFMRKKHHGFSGVPSGKRLHSYGKIHHSINGKIHYVNGHFQWLFVDITRLGRKSPFPSASPVIFIPGGFSHGVFHGFSMAFPVIHPARQGATINDPKVLVMMASWGCAWKFAKKRNLSWEPPRWDPKIWPNLVMSTESLVKTIGKWWFSMVNNGLFYGMIMGW